MGQSDATITLRGRKVRRKWSRSRGGQRIQPARIRVFLYSTNQNPDSRWVHPNIDIDFGSYLGTVSIALQSNRRDDGMVSGYADTRRTARGWADPRCGFAMQPYVGFYAPKITARCETSIDRDRIRATMDLLADADAAIRGVHGLYDRLHRTECDMLRIVVGLRLLGFDVEIYAGAVEWRRAYADRVRKAEAA